MQSILRSSRYDREEILKLIYVPPERSRDGVET
jgi:hypothetical protein